MPLVNISVYKDPRTEDVSPENVRAVLSDIEQRLVGIGADLSANGSFQEVLGVVNSGKYEYEEGGFTKEIDLSSLFNSNALLAELLKSEILNNINLNFNLNINANKFKKYQDFEDIFLNSKIKEGLIDIDNTKFDWKNYAKLEISDSLIHVKDSELILDGKLAIIIKDFQEIYKTLLTPKNYRTKIEMIDLNFIYNFDQKILKLNDIRVDSVMNKNVNNILKNLTLKSDKLQNKIYFKNMINKAIKSYAG